MRRTGFTRALVPALFGAALLALASSGPRVAMAEADGSADVCPSASEEWMYPAGKYGYGYGYAYEYPEQDAGHAATSDDIEGGEVQSTDEYFHRYGYDFAGSEYDQALSGDSTGAGEEEFSEVGMPAATDETDAEEASDDAGEADESGMEDEVETGIEETMEYRAEDAYDHAEAYRAYEYRSEGTHSDEAEHNEQPATQSGEQEDASADTGEPSAYDYGKWEYDYGQWNSEYGRYGTDCEQQYGYEGYADTCPGAEDAGAQESGSETADPAGPYGCEYDCHGDYSEAVQSDRAEESAAEESESEYDCGYRHAIPETRYGYQGYSDAYPEAENAYPEERGDEAGDSGESAAEAADAGHDDTYGDDYRYEYAYPEEHSAAPYGGKSESSDAPAETGRWEDSYDATPETPWEGEPGEEPRHEDEPVTQSAPSYESADPEPGFASKYGWCDDSWSYGKPSEAAAPEAASDEAGEAAASGLEVFAWLPGDLLTDADEELLRTLARLCEDPAAVRRAAMSDYLEGLGWEATDLAERFEDATGIEVLGLADDLPGAAAFLGCYRLLEQDELGTDEAADLLRRTLPRLSEEWTRGVASITSDAFERDDAIEGENPSNADAPADDGLTGLRPSLGAVAGAAARSVADLGGVIGQWAEALKGADWLRHVRAALVNRAAAAHRLPDWPQR